MKKGFSITYDKKRKDSPWRIKMYGIKQQFSRFDWSDTKPKLRCAKCGTVHWQDLEVFKPDY